MGISILDPHPNNECLDLDSNEAWFSFIFCGSHIDKLNLHAYDYYSGSEVADGKNVVYEDVPALENKLNIWNGAGNGVRVNVRDFVKNASVFSSDGEYTWRAELIQDIDIANGKYPDNMIYEGVLLGEPGFYTVVENIPEIDYEHYLPLAPCYKKQIKPPYYVDFLDPKYESTVYDIPVTYDKTQIKKDGTEVSVIQLDTYTSTASNSKAVVRPAVGSRVYVHKKKCYGERLDSDNAGKNNIYIDTKISGINVNENENEAAPGCYLKVEDKYFLIQSYDKNTGIITCQNGNILREYPAGTHYAIYTSRFWTPYCYFRVHHMPKVEVKAEFHERRRLDKKDYDMTTNCIENTANGILFKASLNGDSHSSVKYHYWDIYNENGNLVYHTEKVYSQEMDCEVFVPFGHTYTGKITVVTQDGITVRGEKSYTLPYSPEENNKRLWFGAQQNAFGGIELAWKYFFYRDNSSLQKITDFEFFRVEKKTGKIKYLGKQDNSSSKIIGAQPAHYGGNWYLFDKDCDFTINTLPGAKINMYLVGGGEDGGSWISSPNSLNKSFARGKSGGAGGYFIKKTATSADGILKCSAKIASRNDPDGTSLKIDGTTYRCSDTGSSKRGAVNNGTLTQTPGASVIYGEAQNGIDGFLTPYGYIGSGGGGGAACGGNRSSGSVNSLSVSGITPKYNKRNWLLIDRDCLTNGTGEFDLNIPEGAKVKMYLVGGGSDGAKWYSVPNPPYDINASECKVGGAGGYVLEKELSLETNVHCTAAIADSNDNDGTYIVIGNSTYRCNDSGSTKTPASKSAAAAKNPDNTTKYINGEDGKNGIKTPYGYVGSSGGGGGADNMYRIMGAGKGGNGAGNGGTADTKPPKNGYNAVNYGCGGGGGALKQYSHTAAGQVDRSDPGKGMPGCIIFEIIPSDVPCPDPGKGGTGAGDGGQPGNDGENAVNYGCGGGGAGYYAVDSYGNVKYGTPGLGMQGCVIIEIVFEGFENNNNKEKQFLVDWTAASDKEYRYIVTGCNYESAYLGKDAYGNDIRHRPEEMIECSAYVDITPHFEDFYMYFLDDADVLVKHEYNLEKYDVPLTEPMGRYVTSRNNPYKTVKRHMHTLALERESKAFYRSHTWRIEGNVEIDNVTHNITGNINPLYAKMPSVTIEPTDYDNFSMKFLFGYLNCDKKDGSDFEFNDQYMFELWKKCITEKRTLMIKDPKGNVWTGALTSHGYKIEYDTSGIPYIITINFTQTRTEYNTLVILADENNKYLRTAEDNHLTAKQR